MSWCVERLPWTSLVLLTAPLLASGCYDSHECGPEICDYDDQDCDRIIDEDFLDEDGIYATLEHCGGCNVACPAVFPTAAETACEVDRERGTAACVIVACPAGWHRAGDGACAPDVVSLCLTCTEDEDCTLREPGAACREMPTGERRCLSACDGTFGCPPGFDCGGDGLCSPSTGICGCTEETIGAELACLVERDPDYSCAGVQRCTEEGIGACEPILVETCNDQDDDCDFEVDEDFRDEAGRYIDRLHCGGCAIPCVEPGPNMSALCEPRGEGPSAVECVVECLEGFVDVDGILANGCECERFDGEGPPPVVGGDADCDGAPDETNDYVYVATTGSDTNPGTLERPMRTLQGALGRGAAEEKDVLVSRGVYDAEVTLVPGVSAYGGYRPDFRDRDLTLFPVVLEHTRGEPGAPVVRCEGIREETRFEGFEIHGSDATRPGRGSTALFSDGCGPEVGFAATVVLAGRGADGISGLTASEVLRDRFGAALADLDGRDGTTGFPGTLAGTCNPVVGGNAGARTCPDTTNVSGGAGGGSACPETGCVNGRACGNSGCTDYTVGGVCDFPAMMAAAVPNPAAESGRGVGAGAAGARTYNAPTNRGVCNFCDDNPTLQRNGDPGADGSEGVDGTGGSGCRGVPRFDPASGTLAGVAGSGGTDGTNGAGGGGGTSGGGYEVIGGTSGSCTDHSGGSGGGGGSGGCGSPGATGGTGGGGSVAVLVRLGPGLGAGPSFTDVRVVTASAGRGGRGGQGASGGAAGSGANGGNGRHWCARNGARGGDGGRGGAGGGGGGGCGGSTHGIAVVPQGGSPAAYVDALSTVTIDRVGVAGAGGGGGFSPSASGTAGAAGSDDAIRVL